MILKHTKSFSKIIFIHVFYFFIILFTCFSINLKADNTNLSELEKVYSDSFKAYKQKDYWGATENLDKYFSDHEFDKIDPLNKSSKYTSIINDYAFFLQKLFASQMSDICKDPSSTSPRDIMVFRSQTMDNAEKLLLFVTVREPNRMVAYLNLADVQFSLDKVEEANKNYKKYVALMKKSGKSKIIPKRALYQNIRKKLYICE